MVMDGLCRFGGDACIRMAKPDCAVAAGKCNM